MLNRPELDAEALALLRALRTGRVRGIRALSERLSGRSLRAPADVAVLARHAAIIRMLIDAGYLKTVPQAQSVVLGLSWRGRWAIRSVNRMGWAVGSSMLAAGVAGCSPMPLEPYQPRVMLMGAPVLTGLAQVRDPVTGSDYFAPCDPCAVPTPKTPVGQVISEGKGGITSLSNPPDPAILAQDSGSVSRETRPPAHLIRPVGEDAEPVTRQVGVVSRALFFDSASAHLDEGARQEIEALVPLARQARFIHVRGRTDSTGAIQANRALALARAIQVRRVLLAHGIEASKVKVFYCTHCHVADNHSEAGRRTNRRVEIELKMPLGWRG